jgi:hypothetical protein
VTPTDVDSYLRELDRALRRRFVVDATILEEVRNHLAEAIEAREREGCAFPEASTAAIERFGSVEIVATAYAADRTRALHRVLFVGALAFGIAITYIDSRPTWDDTGITAGAMLLGAGVLGLLGPRRPWAWALLVGFWIPAYAIARAPSTGSLAMLIVLVFPFVGAYLGMALRRGLAPGR